MWYVPGMSAATLNILGLLLNLVGVLGLFRYGMPYRVRTGGASAFLLEGEDDEAKRIEARYDAYGWVAITLVVLGTLAQIVANLKP
jgi:hypothetical protein